jgi:hypothetical protein
MWFTTNDANLNSYCYISTLNLFHVGFLLMQSQFLISNHSARRDAPKRA